MFDISKTSRNIEMFLFDIFIAIKKIQYIVKDFNNAEELQYSWKDWDSVIREFEILGEASKYLLKEKLLNKEYQVIVDFRNKISHNYFGIDSDIVLFIAKNELNELLDVIVSLIKKIDKGLKEELIDSFIEDNKYIDFIVKDLKELKNV